MNRWLKDNLMSSLTLGAIIGAAVYFTGVQNRWFTSPENRYETEKVVKQLDLNKVYGEYIMDSIEEVETKRFRLKQIQQDCLYMRKFQSLDSLLRLNVYLSNKGVKQNDTLSREVNHALEHVDN